MRGFVPPSSGTGKALCLKGVAWCPGLSRSRPIPPLTLTQTQTLCCDRSPGGAQTLTSCGLSLRAREVRSSSLGGCPCIQVRTGAPCIAKPCLGEEEEKEQWFLVALDLYPSLLPSCPCEAAARIAGCSFGQTGFLNHRQLDSGNLLSVILNTLSNVYSDTEAGFQERS